MPYLGISSVYYAITIGWILMIIYEGWAYKKYFKEITQLKPVDYNVEYRREYSKV